MSASEFTQSELLEKFETALANAEHPEIAPALTAVGYDDTALAADRDLLTQTRAARATQQQEAAEASRAHAAEADAEKAARAAFVLLHRLIQLADRRAPDLDLKSLLQTGALPAAEAAFLDYATSLLDRIEANADVAAALAPVGVNTARMTGLRDLLAAMRQANVTQEKEQGEAEQATAVYHALIEQTRLAYDLMVIFARQGLADNPQLLELLGFGAV
jgi:hypothetical protein